MEHLKKIFNEIVKNLPEQKIKFSTDSNGEIILEFERILTTDDVESIKYIINTLTKNHYSLNSSLFVKYFSKEKLSNSNRSEIKLAGEFAGVFFDYIRQLKNDKLLNSEGEELSLEGKYIRIIKFVESWRKISRNKESYIKSEILYWQRKIDSDITILDSLPTKIEGDTQCWFIINSTREDFDLNIHSMNQLLLVVKKGRIVNKVVGYIDFRSQETKYWTETTFVLPQYRKRGFSKFMDLFIQERTGLNYATDLDFTKQGFLKMIGNKKILKYESFISKIKF
jgi:hypothetical protein